MSHRLSVPLVGWLLIVTASGCSSDPAPSTCQIEKHRLEGTMLTLLSAARLDAVGDGFVLAGSDGQTVRWASLGKGGALGAEHVIDVPAHASGPWFATAGTNAPGDRFVIAYVPAGAAATGMVDLMTFSVAFDNTMPSLPTLFGQIPASARVAMSSGRGGMHAALVWGVPGSRTISARVLGGDGHGIGTDLGVGAPADFDCLRFSPGRADMTLGYVDLSGTPPAPTFVGMEIGADGAPQPSFRLPVGRQPTSCVEVAPTAEGYALAWHSTGIGTYFGTFTVGNPQFPTFEVLPDVRVSGTPPSLSGIGWMGKGYAVLFSRETGTEVWPIDAMGHRQGSVPAFPSTGVNGQVSSQAAGTEIFATYADYSGAGAPADKTSGARFLVKVACP